MSHKHRHRKHKRFGREERKTFLILMIAAVVIVLGAGAYGYKSAIRADEKTVRRSSETQSTMDAAASGSSINDSNTVASSTATTAIIDNFDGTITYNGVKYKPNTSIETVLFLGIDDSDQTRQGAGIDEGGRSDTMILFIIDKDKELITPLEINRDTMVGVDIYNNDGEFLYTGQEQITMQYSYGRSAREACNLTKQKVADLLMRTRINNVVSLTMDGIEPSVDAIGGVTLKLQSDETDLDPMYTEGAVITLNGKEAFDFVHTRDVETRGSNMDRMSRQTQFMLALSQTARQKGTGVINVMEEAAGDYLYEDMSADIADCFAKYAVTDTVYMLPGDNVEGVLHDEFYVDNEELTKLIIQLFYVEN